MRYSLSLCLLCLAVADVASAQSARQIDFAESDADLPNPERGFYRFRDLTRPQDFDLRGENVTLIFGRIVADRFRYEPLSDDFLREIQEGFDRAREHGIKVIPRVAYNRGPHPGKRSQYGDDAPKEVILEHIRQLKSLWEKNQDVISVMDAGFIGGWGEWHSSANGLDNPRDRKDILFAILDALPKDRMVVQRYPGFKREIFGGSLTASEPVLTQETAFDRSNLARVGHLNDCFLSSKDDVGTYKDLGEGWSLRRELDYLAAEGPFVPFGGETCRPHERGRCENAVREMELLHVDYLNHDYNGKVIQRWRDEGCYDEIRRRLGYRFVLRSARLPESLTAGGALDLKVTLANVGFGELFNPRPVEVILKNNSTGKEWDLPLRDDPRYWSGGQEVTVKATLPLPSDLPEGGYTLGLRLPDAAPSLRDDVRYAIRFANEDVWDAAAGVNVLVRDLRVSGPDPGR